MDTGRHPSEEEARIIDLEEFASRSEAPPRGPRIRYRYRIDKKRFVVNEPVIRGQKLFDDVGADPRTTKMLQILRGQEPKPIQPQDKVNLCAPGVERFFTMPCDAKNGEDNALRRGFPLIEEDLDYLESRCFTWEALVEQKQRWLIIHNFPVPAGYTHTRVSVALLLPNTYPEAQIDMAYFSPSLARKDGRAIKRLASHTLDGKAWQRWSRHRTEKSTWRPGIDNLSTHLAYVSAWLEGELTK